MTKTRAKMKIILIFPFKNNIHGGPFKWLPLSSGYLSDYFEKKFPVINFSQIDLEEELLFLANKNRLNKSFISFIDDFLEFKFEFIEEKINDPDLNLFLEKIFISFNLRNYDHYFFSIYSYDLLGIQANILLANYLKNKFPKKKIIFGGQGLFNLKNKSIMLETIENLKCVDSFVGWESESSMDKLVTDLFKNRKIEKKYNVVNKKELLNNIPSYKNFKSLKCFNYPVKNISEFYKINLPIKKKRIVFIPYFFSTGCFYSKCAYCPSSNHKNIVNFKPIEQIISDIKYLKSIYKTKHFIFFNDNFNFNLKFTKKLLRAFIDNNLDILWTDSFNLIVLDQEIIELLPMAGCFRCDIGLSIVNPELQKLYNNIVQDSKYLENIKKLSIVGLWTHLNLILNLPYHFSAKNDKEIISKYSSFIDSVTYTNYIRFPGSTLNIDYDKYDLLPVYKKIKIKKGDIFADKDPVLYFLEKNFEGRIQERERLYKKINSEYVCFLEKKDFVLQRIHLHLLGLLYENYGHKMKENIKNIVKEADFNISKYKYYKNFVKDISN